MPNMRKIMETVARFIPDGEPDPLIGKHSHVSRPVDRIDGRLKVTGKAPFTAEFAIDGLTHAALANSTIAKGRIARIDLSEAQAAPGVVAILTHENAPRLKRPSLLNVNNVGKGVGSSDLPIMQDDAIHYDGQAVAVVVAQTLEQAEHAASLVRVEYAAGTARVSFDALKGEAETPSEVLGEDPEVRKGDAEAALAAASFQVDNVYRTPRHNHNALEPHATIALWESDDELLVYDSTQFVNGTKHQLARVFRLKPDDVRVISPFVGGAFGGKWALWSNTVLCAAAAKIAGRPVKLFLSREGTFRIIGGRTMAEQRVALGADRDGRFTALVHTGTTATTSHANFPEQFSLLARHLYDTETKLIGQKVFNLDTVANTWMRAPGEAMATFALESAIDELAHKMGIDPIELRRINEPEKDPTKGTAFSSRNLLEAYRRGAEKFGWSGRSAEPGTRRDGKWLIGQGVATAYYPVFRFPATVRVRLDADGSALVQAAGSEMGMGTATAQIQHAAERLGLPMDKVSFEYGDSALPDSAVTAGGSSQTATIMAAVQPAVEKLHKKLMALVTDDSPLAGANDVEARDGGLYRVGESGAGESYAAILQRAGQAYLEVEASSSMPMETMKYSMASYGAQFCEVRVNAETGELRVSRWLGSFDCGRIINPKTAASQFRGGIIMGIGMALSEETQFDDRRGRIVNRSLAEYHIPVHLDVPDIEVIYTDIPDALMPLGARGVGEIGITGTAAAIANAVFNATGKRIRDLPITLDKLL